MRDSMSPVAITPGGARAPGVRTLRAAVLVGLMLASFLLPVSGQAASCAAGFPAIRLDGFSGQATTRPFYPVGESDAAVQFRIVASGGCGDNWDMTVTYTTSGGSASPSDYTPVSQPAFFDNVTDEPMTQTHSVNITEDADHSEFVESANLVLSNPINTSLAHPSTAPIMIIEDDGASRVGLEGVPYSQSETFPGVQIPVFRAGAASSVHQVGYSITAGPGNPATPGQDVSPTSGSISFGVGQRAALINLSLNNDTVGEGPEEFTVTLDQGSPSSMTFTIIDNEEEVFPTSRFHHPRHKWKYAKSDYRIREFHIFVSDNPGGAGVVGAELALRRNLKNGTCAWKTKSGWEKKDCSNRTWLSTRFDNVGQLFFYRMSQLKPSVGTRVVNYTAFSRAIDGAGNVERDFVQKRNDNTFEIKKRRRRN
jgi:hypothetical protein